MPVKEHEGHLIPITQRIRPDGRTKTVQAPVTAEHKAWVEEHQPVLSAEILPVGKVALYGRLKEWEEESEIILMAENFRSEYSPAKMLNILINMLMEAQNEAERKN